MEDADWLADMLDELQDFAVQYQDDEIVSSVERIREIYETELDERITRPQKPHYTH